VSNVSVSLMARSSHRTGRDTRARHCRSPLTRYAGLERPERQPLAARVSRRIAIAWTRIRSLRMDRSPLRRRAVAHGSVCARNSSARGLKRARHPTIHLHRCTVWIQATRSHHSQLLTKT
jgi:hypothetical protein